MSHANLVLLILIGVLCGTVIAASSSISCWQNEMWANCTRLCRELCRSRFVEACYEGEICLHGCNCIQGYAIISTDDCIRASDCAKMRRQDVMNRANITLLEVRRN